MKLLANCFIFIGFWLHAAHAPIEGILIEGMDFSGKSTVCKLLKERFTGKNIKENHFYLSSHPLIRFLFDKAMQAGGTPDEPFYYACGVVLDHTLFRLDPEAFYIQDRNWLTQDCWLRFLHPKTVNIPENYIIKNSYPFKWNIYLTLSYETFKHRYQQRTKKSHLNTLFFEDKDLFTKYNEFCLSRLPTDQHWVVINTDALTPDEVVDQIIQYCQ